MSKQTAAATVTLDRNIPPPSTKASMSSKFEFEKMELNQSFFEPGSTSHCARVAGAARDFARGRKVKFTSKRFKKGQEYEGWVAPADGVRIWRIK